MGTTYTRQESGNITDGSTIEASHFNNEFNQIESAFASSTGHTHDGTTGEGGPITKLLGTAITIGDGTAATDIAVTFDGETNDGLLTWMEDEDYFKFSDDILINTTEKLQFRDTALYINSSVDGQLDIVADTEVQIATTTLDINANADVSGTLTYGSLSDGSITITAFVDEDDMTSNSATLVPTQQSVKAYVDAQITAADLDFQGDSGGALSIDLDSETLTIAGGTGIDTSGSLNTLTVAIDSTVATLTGSQTLTNKTLTTPIISSISNTGTLTLPTSTDTLVGRATTDTLTNKTLTSAVLNTSVSGTAVLDEDNMASDSATQLATQQSIKAYVDAQVATANELTELTDVTITSVADNEVLAYDSTSSKWINQTAAEAGLVTLTGSETLTNKTLTTPIISSISNTGTLTLPTSTDTLVGKATTDTLTNKTLTSPVLNGTLSGTAFLDEDTMSSDSATAVASQQSIKAYVDSQVTSYDTLAELTDTNITTPADASLLFYDTGTSKWIDNVVSGDISIADTGVAAIGSGVIVNDDVNASAAIAYSKLNLSDSIVNADINASAAIVDTKLATISTADKVSGAAIQIDGATDGTAITVDTTDKLLIDDAGTTKYINVSQLPSSGASAGFAVAMAIAL